MKSTKLIYLLFMLSVLPTVVAAGKTARDSIRLETTNGELNLRSLHGKVVYLDFWASWCRPCRQSFPWMNRMHEKYAADGLVILAVNEDANRKDAEVFLRKVPAAFKVAFDGTSELAENMQLEAMPSSFLVGKDGSIIKKHLGFKTGKTDEYEAAIRSALGLPPL